MKEYVGMKSVLYGGGGSRRLKIKENMDMDA